MPTYLSPGVYMEEVSSGSKPIEGVGTAVAAFVGFAEAGPVNTPILVTNWTQFVSNFGGFMEGSYLAHAVYAYFLNGGGVAYVVRIGADDSNGESEAPAAKAELPGADSDKAPFTVKAIEGGSAGDGITVEVADASEPTDDNFKLIVRSPGKSDEIFDNVTTGRGANNVVTRVKAESQLITIQEVRGATAKPARTTTSLSGGALPARIENVEATDYIGDAADRTGFAGLEAVEDVTMLLVPDLMAAYQQGMVDLDGVKAVQLAMIAHCELMANRVAILDTPPGLNAQQVKAWRNDVTGYDSKYATMYWPWIKVMDPVQGKGIFVPPGGSVAGVWARNDDTRGVHKAPANEVIRGAMALELNITKGEHDQLNPDAINCIRSFPGQGIRIWGGPHPHERSRVALPQRAPAVQLRRVVDLGRHELGRVRTERPEALGLRHPHGHDVPAARVARWCALRADPSRGVLRQVRRREQPAREPGRRDPHRRDRHRPCQAGRVRRVPDQPVQRRRRARGVSRP